MVKIHKSRPCYAPLWQQNALVEVRGHLAQLLPQKAAPARRALAQDLGRAPGVFAERLHEEPHIRESRLFADAAIAKRRAICSFACSSRKRVSLAFSWARYAGSPETTGARDPGPMPDDQARQRPMGCPIFRGRSF